MDNNYRDDLYIYTRNYKYPIGKLTTTRLITLDADQDWHNLRNLEAEVHLINHLFANADLSKNIYLFSSKAICSSCGGIRYYQTPSRMLNVFSARIDTHKIFNGAPIEENDTNNKFFEEMPTLIDYPVNEFLKIHSEYVYAGALGQFAGFVQAEGGRFYAAEENLTTGNLYKWNYDGQTKKMYKLFYEEKRDKWTASKLKS